MKKEKKPKLLEYFKGDELASSVWKDKYAREGEITPDDMHRRLAKEFAKIEEEYIGVLLSGTTPVYPDLSDYGKSRDHLTEDSIYELFKDFKYVIPQGSIMANLGSTEITSLSNCFVIGQPKDSYGGIFEKDEQLVQLMKRRGGVGIDISTLRPEGTATTNAAKTATGAVSFMHRFSNTTREVAQQGRRGALMISIDINHPDVLEFIKIKRDLTQITGANISIKLNNEFMEAVENDEDYILRFPCDHPIRPSWSNIATEYDKLYKTPQDGNSSFKKIKAREYWNEIIKSAHNVAEPGLIFEDNHINYSPDGAYEQYRGVTTNPCGEIFMQPYDACRLIAVNLFSFVKDPFTEKASFDHEMFYKVNYEAMRLSDDLIDMELDHIDRILSKIDSDPEDDEVKAREKALWLKIRGTASSSRRTGLGFTALGDTLSALGVGYDSPLVVETIMKTKLESELDCTIDLAILRGTFKGWDRDTEFDLIASNEFVGSNPFYDFIAREFPMQAERMFKYGRRNVSFNTVAPTGTVSLLSQTTSGLEPLFKPFYMRRKKVSAEEGVRVDFTDQNGDTWQEFPVLHPKFKFWVEDIMKLDSNVSEEELQKLFIRSPWSGSTAEEIGWKDRVELQSIIQKYITHSISSTVNLPNDVTEEEVAKIYIEAWKQGLKGITVYRDGSRSGVLVSNDNSSSESFEYKDAVKRPKTLDCDIHATSIKGQRYNVIVGLYDGKPYEVFIDSYFTSEKGMQLVKVKKGRYDLEKDGKTYSEDITTEMTDEQAAVTRLISTGLRHGADIKFLTEQLNKSDGDIFSFTKGIARVLKKYIPNGSKSTVSCNECGSNNVVFEEGCNKCLDCGSSACS